MVSSSISNGKRVSPSKTNGKKKSTSKQLVTGSLRSKSWAGASEMARPQEKHTFKVEDVSGGTKLNGGGIIWAEGEEVEIKIRDATEGEVLRRKGVARKGVFYINNFLGYENVEIDAPFEGYRPHYSPELLHLKVRKSGVSLEMI